MPTMDAFFSGDVITDFPTSAPQVIGKGSKGSKRGGEALFKASSARGGHYLHGIAVQLELARRTGDHL